MTDFSQSVLASGLRLVTDTVIVQVQLVAAVPARIDAEGDGINLAVTVQLTNVLLHPTLGYDGAFPDVNCAVVSTGVIPRGVEIQLHPSRDRRFERILVICETVPLTSSGEIDGAICLT